MKQALKVLILAQKYLNTVWYLQVSRTATEAETESSSLVPGEM